MGTWVGGSTRPGSCGVPSAVAAPPNRTNQYATLKSPTLRSALARPLRLTLPGPHLPGRPLGHPCGPSTCLLPVPALQVPSLVAHHSAGGSHHRLFAALLPRLCASWPLVSVLIDEGRERFRWLQACAPVPNVQHLQAFLCSRPAAGSLPLLTMPGLPPGHTPMHHARPAAPTSLSARCLCM